MMMYVIAVGFIAFDVLTGIVKALYLGEFNSSIMREGGWHKASEILALVGAAFIDWALRYLDLGFEGPISNVVVVYICLMETLSSIENICLVNPQLSKLFEPYLNKLK